MPRALIAVVDPDRRTRACAKAALRAEGFAVVGVSSGLEALALCACGRVDLVLIELGLGGMGAEAVVRALHQRFPALPIVALSTNRAASIPSGVADLLVKPVDADAMVACVRRALAHVPKKQARTETLLGRRRADARGS